MLRMPVARVGFGAFCTAIASASAALSSSSSSLFRHRLLSPPGPPSRRAKRHRLPRERDPDGAQHHEPERHGAQD